MDILLCIYLVYIPPHFPEDFHLTNPKIWSHCAVFADCLLRETIGDNRAGFQSWQINAHMTIVEISSMRNVHTSENIGITRQLI